MNKHSKICALIRQNPDTWEQIMQEKKIRVKKDNNSDLAIFNYEIDADFFDPIVQEARGIIIHLDTLDVACFPFRKFGNSHEGYADDIDWNTARVQEKVDGSIIKLWRDKQINQWVWATNGCIYAGDAKTPSGLSYANLICRTKEYKWLSFHFDVIDRLDATYIFELVSPDNQVVLNYPEPKLYFLGARDNITGEEFIYNEFDGHIDKPKEYPLHSLEDCIEAAKKLNAQSKDGFPIAEGFVVVDKEWHRIKIKSPEYLIWHHQINNGILKGDGVYKLMRSDDFNEDVFKENVSEYTFRQYISYKKKIADVIFGIRTTIELAKQLEKKGSSRKEIAIAIKDLPYKAYGFKALDYPDSSKEEIIQMCEDKLMRTLKSLVPDVDYEGE